MTDQAPTIKDILTEEGIEKLRYRHAWDRSPDDSAISVFWWLSRRLTEMSGRIAALVEELEEKGKHKSWLVAMLEESNDEVASLDCYIDVLIDLLPKDTRRELIDEALQIKIIDSMPEDFE